MKRLIQYILAGLLMISHCAFANTEADNIALIKNLFSQCSEKLDASVLDDYYAPDFILVSNQQTYDYSVYKKQQIEIFKTLKSLKVLEYSDIFSSGDKVAARMTIKLVKKTGESHVFYVILIAHIKNHKVDRIWEMTYPTWSDKLPTGKSGHDNS